MILAPKRVLLCLPAHICIQLPERLTSFPPQVHNPEYLNDTAISSMVRDHGIRLLAISPHVGNYARQVLEEQGVQVRWLGGSYSCWVRLVLAARRLLWLLRNAGVMQTVRCVMVGVDSVRAVQLEACALNAAWPPTPHLFMCRLSWTGLHP